jgi:lysophospholipase L1-like esterase
LEDCGNPIKNNQTTPKFAIKFANMIFILGTTYWVVAGIYVIYRLYVPYHEHNFGNREYERTYYYYLLIIVSFGILFSLCLRLRERVKVNLALIIFSLIICIYSTEIYFELPGDSENKNQKIAEELGVPFDKRSYREVIQSLRDKGLNAYPNVLPVQYLKSNGLVGEAGNIYPLGGISNITTAFGNEGGFFPIIEMDEYGFNNPKQIINKGNVDIVLIGDSFTGGHSVHADENIGAVLRKLGLNVISLGKSGNGPLIEYATLKEYAEHIKPKVVVWIYFKNDLSDLLREKSSPLLMQYLNEDDFSQNLISRQMEIDQAYAEDVNQKWERKNENRAGIARDKFFHIIKLYNIRMFVYQDILKLDPNYPNPIYKPIMAKGKKLVNSWGGKLYFVYLPSFRESQERELSELNKYVLGTIAELKIPTIDAHKEIFSAHVDPKSLFPLRIKNHYNAEGYRLVAGAIAKRLREDGIFQLNHELN